MAVDKTIVRFCFFGRDADCFTRILHAMRRFMHKQEILLPAGFIGGYFF